ncbi:MAG: prepilin peptidase [Brevinematales bacterium]|nr:prepilin peptidase [Brevinematales bacterium]
MSFEWVDYFRYGVLAVFSFACIFTDLRSRQIYNTITLPVLVFAMLSAVFTGRQGGIFLSVYGALLGAVLFLPGTLLGKTGAGDLKLSAALGALLGWKLLLTALTGAGIITLIIIIIVKIRGNKNRPQEFPLGVILSAAAFAAGLISFYGFNPDRYF